MHVISRRPFDSAANDFPNHALVLDAVYKVLKSTSYRNPDELREEFPSLDRMKYRDKWWVINIAGNHLRMLFFADFGAGKIFVKHIVTHAEYDKLVKRYRETKE
ncbi:addiction module toxin RelE [Kosakonia radicincitans DSM 16656]|uniref:mRNA interferase HigB n=1 Tax=Kosakonia radicincitans TaxID=283686 RepID=A0AAX2EZ48_9ENTR|nr:MULTISPECIES: type II toxin-antitoxin system HigB family toxin [Kosakonia]MDP9568894.1 mRNA interferase HigB [Kosakonia oryzae]ARD63141.1 addiction module toxin RelE [Kosakonia radicincitans DSM 16656]MDD7998522.1 type II toxin-antitoxin system HigB family toxin [Kosakonia radicincitans]PTA87077.1 addiction module toxin RelE [Kosakonia sp. H7A]SET53173.1 mRNA interferase HigB [Kosakonia radicincitans]